MNTSPDAASYTISSSSSPTRAPPSAMNTPYRPRSGIVPPLVDRERAARPSGARTTPGDAVPDDARPQLGELVGRVAARRACRARRRTARGRGRGRGRRGARRACRSSTAPLVHRGHARRSAARARRAGSARTRVVLDLALAACRSATTADLEQVAAELGEDPARDEARRPGGRRGRPAAGRARPTAGDSTCTTRSTAPMSMPSSSDEVATSAGSSPGLERILDLGAAARARASRGGRARCPRRRARSGAAASRSASAAAVDEHDRRAVRARSARAARG